MSFCGARAGLELLELFRAYIPEQKPLARALHALLGESLRLPRRLRSEAVRRLEREDVVALRLEEVRTVYHEKRAPLVYLVACRLRQEPFHPAAELDAHRRQRPLVVRYHPYRAHALPDVLHARHARLHSDELLPLGTYRNRRMTHRRVTSPPASPAFFSGTSDMLHIGQSPGLSTR